MSRQYSPWETKQNKTPPYTKILKIWPWQMRSQLIPFFQMTENHSSCWPNSLKCHGPIRKFLGNTGTILALAFRKRDNWYLSSWANLHQKSRDRKSRCSFRGSSACWLGFYRHFSHYENSHYKNCKIKGNLQICCWVFITELIETQTKQKPQYKSFSTSWKTKRRTGPSSVGLKAWLTSSLGHSCSWHRKCHPSKFYIFTEWIQGPVSQHTLLSVTIQWGEKDPNMMYKKVLLRLLFGEKPPSIPVWFLWDFFITL